MKVEEDLDHVIEQHIDGRKPCAPIDDSITLMLAAAKLLRELQKIAIPLEFAHRVEVALRARLRNRSRQYI